MLKLNRLILWMITPTILLSINTLAAEDYIHTVTTDISAITFDGHIAAVEDGEMISEPGAPALGYRIVKLVLPPNTAITGITVESANPTELAVGNIDFIKGDIATGNYPADTVSSANPAIFNSDDIYPVKRAEILSRGHWGNINLVDLAVYPLACKPLSGKLLFYPEITVHISLKSSVVANGLAPKNDAFAYAALEQRVDNGLDLPLLASSYGGGTPTIAGNIPTPEYLIITSAEIAPGFFPFLNWKNQKGIPADIVFIEDILAMSVGQDPAEKLRNYLIQAYNGGVRWVLLGGDEDVVPIRYLYPGNVRDYIPTLNRQQVSDMYYADLTGDWDADGDGVWGESYHDLPDIYPELYVGRVPARTAEHASVWGNKAILYEKNPGNGDPSYLTKALFICADQMRDYGQHEVLAGMLPGNFYYDADRLIEQPSGNTYEPVSPLASTVINVMQEGWGFISNLNHGDISWYSARSCGYNAYGYSGVWGDIVPWGGCGALSNLTTYNQPSVQYSISCDLGAFDFDKEIFRPAPYPSPYCFAESFILEPGSGVAFLGNTRWGWVSPSYNMERKFFDHIFVDSTSRLSVAEALSKIDYPNYRDIGYGHNLFGDPEMSLWLSVDGNLVIEGPTELDPNILQQVQYRVLSNGNPVQGAAVCIYRPGELFARTATDASGYVSFEIDPQADGYIMVTASKIRYIPDQNAVVVGAPLGTDNEIHLPSKPMVHQNYPNPFNSNTTIEFNIPERSSVELDIYDISGRLVRKLVSGEFPAGSNQVTWNGANDAGRDAASGVYFYKFSTGPTVLFKQMTMLK